MNKLYNTQAEITNKIREFLKNNVLNLRKNIKITEFILLLTICFLMIIMSL